MRTARGWTEQRTKPALDSRFTPNAEVVSTVEPVRFPSHQALAVGLPGRCATAFATAALLIAVTGSLHAQGVQVISTAAGTGLVGYTGDNGAATSATLAAPSAVAYDASGNLYLADTQNHVVRKISKATGTITTIAGTSPMLGRRSMEGATSPTYRQLGDRVVSHHCNVPSSAIGRRRAVPRRP